MPRSVGGMEIENDGQYVKVTLSNGVYVKFNGKFRSHVHIPKEKYAGKVTGIMGNLDGIALNDLRTKNGTIVSKDKDGYKLIGDSWKIDPE